MNRPAFYGCSLVVLTLSIAACPTQNRTDNRLATGAGHGSGAARTLDPSQISDIGFIASELCNSTRVCFSAGLSQLGQNATESRFEERPARLARLRAFAMDRREVTVSQYSACVAQGRCAAVANCGAAQQAPDAPMNCVQWDEARTYCEAQGGRLPTEAEWERAAGGLFPEHRKFPWGDDPAGPTRDTTVDGMENLGGGVAEWIADFGGFYLPPRSPSTARDAGTASDAFADASASSDAGAVAISTTSPDNSENETADAAVESIDAGALPIVDNPRGPRESPWHVVRGGHRNAPVPRWTSSARTFRLPNDRMPWLGFRCAYGPSGQEPVADGGLRRDSSQ